ncbi:cytochrome bd-I ubiquinol oxidase subunit 1 apoprotein [Chitinophaga niastensis]|uniref:Cytochrome bd-I ubiquinol oxidase subunit 1 apoprotein n=1 Tax=Chitinophaga niastensis TaxID=536980 RepID=A0A2P8HU61_CHINA|nr:cytochrome ubiquinol oxidase subunit I [Chitinophaga niastensis]PSL49742.1 cytochrome bd-I ubiquinol oxidase subunit 1 apoprotein [Chitinophaga niastensis]
MPSVEILSRIQFAFTIAFHYIYPPLSIGLGLCLVIMEGLYLKTGLSLYKDITRFWIKVFALIFGIGVATGIVMEFEFGTNWATYSHYVGDIFGSALAAEGIFAFAMESAFLGVLLFGWNRVNKGVHFFSTCMVALGSIFSALWIVIANSWQQTPAGYKIEGHDMQARAVVTDFWEMIFNPSSVDRFSHVIIGSFLAGSFLVMSVAAWYILKQRFVKHSQAMFKVGLGVAVIAALMQLFTGHRSAHYVSKYQPAKLAAMEGHYDSSSVAPMYIMGWVDNKNQKTTGIKIPGGLSFLVHGSFSAPVEGLRATPEKDRPGAVNFVFQMYHIMITIGMTLIGLTLLAVILLWRKKLFNQRWLMIIFAWAVLLPQIANQVGWYAAEVGRQPWVVYKLLRTSDALSRKVTSDQVMFSLILFTLVYMLLFTLFIYLLTRKIHHGPDISENAESDFDGYYHDNITHHPSKI